MLEAGGNAMLGVPNDAKFLPLHCPHPPGASKRPRRFPLSKSVFYGAFAWAWRALNSRRRFLARAGAAIYSARPTVVELLLACGPAEAARAETLRGWA